MSAPRLLPARGLLAGALLVASATLAVAAPPPWEFKDGDRVVFVGDTFIERAQRYGYLETALTLANADKRVTFRNLGWSGDTVRGLSRAGFDPPEAGFRQLVQQVTDAQPTVLVVGYGMAESFDGEAGLPRFVEGYNAFLDAVASLKARLVLMSPLPHAKMPPPLPDPTAHDRDLTLYARAIRSIAEARGAAFVNVYGPFAQWYEPMTMERRASLTDDGIHLNGLGYWTLAGFVGAGYVQAPIRGGALGVATIETHPIPNPVADRPGEAARLQRFRIKALAPGTYSLVRDGRALATASAEEWAGAGRGVPFGPESDKFEELRKTIVAKNRLFFYRWRPQNMTYLFGFRKHEQGQNAVEVPRFDPLVEAKEREIAELLKTIPHTYELIREPESAR